jgi:hypothetical protein
MNNTQMKILLQVERTDNAEMTLCFFIINLMYKVTPLNESAEVITFLQDGREINDTDVMKKIKTKMCFKKISVAGFSSSGENPDAGPRYLSGVNSSITHLIESNHFTGALADIGKYKLLRNQTLLFK